MIDMNKWRKCMGTEEVTLRALYRKDAKVREEEIHDGDNDKI